MVYTETIRQGLSKDERLYLSKTVGMVCIILLAATVRDVSENPFSESGADLFPGQIDVVWETHFGRVSAFVLIFDQIKNINRIVVSYLSSNSSQFLIFKLNSNYLEFSTKGLLKNKAPELCIRDS